MNPIIPIGVKTPYGIIGAIHSKDGERSYFMIDKHKMVSLIPEDILIRAMEEEKNDNRSIKRNKEFGGDVASRFI